MPTLSEDESDLITAYLEEDYTDPDQHRRVVASRQTHRNPTSTASIVPDSKRSVSPMSSHSEASEDTHPTTASIAPLQDIDPIHDDKQSYQPLQSDDPRSFDLVEPRTRSERPYSLEDRVALLLSKKHLRSIFADARLFLKFTTFLSVYRPKSIPLLVYYLDTTKALKAIAYSNAILDGLEAVPFVDFTNNTPKNTTNEALRRNASEAFAILAQEDLPAYVTHTFVGVVSSSLYKKITGTMTPQLRAASEGLAEVFCITDMSKPDNPVIFTSDEFHRTTQYSSSYAVGRNCRFLQGPYTDMFATRRIQDAVRNGRNHQDILLNHRRDGSPFLNLLTIAPLLDDQGKVRYFIGAQADVSGLVRNCTNLEALARLVDNQEHDDSSQNKDKKDEFQLLCEMFNHSELATVRLHGGRMHTEQYDDDDNDSCATRASNKPRLLIREASQDGGFATARYSTFGSALSPDTSLPQVPAASIGRLPGIFAHYLILRPHPSLRITFTSPSLRIPGLLQSPFLSRIGGSRRVREELALALAEGRNVTANIRWLTERSNENGSGDHDEYFLDSSALTSKTRWIHCTPLLGPARVIGAWVVIMVDNEESNSTKNGNGEKTAAMDHVNGQSDLAHGRSTRKHPETKPDGLFQQTQASFSVDGNDWNLDLDISASEIFPPLSPSSKSLAGDTIGYTNTGPKRDFSGSFPLAPSPPPTTSIPPIPSIREILGNTTPRSASLRARSKTTAGGHPFPTQDPVSPTFNLHSTTHYPPRTASPFAAQPAMATGQANDSPKLPSTAEFPPIMLPTHLPSRTISRNSLEKVLPALDQGRVGNVESGQVNGAGSAPGHRRGFAHRMLHGFKKTNAAAAGVNAVVDGD